MALNQLFRQKSRLRRGSRRSRQGSLRSIRLEQLESRRLLAAGTDELSPLSDEFTDSSSISSWMRVHETEGWNADQLQVWDIDQTQTGRMVMQPESVTWYQDYRGPMAFKSVSGDFVFTTQVVITDRDDVGGSDGDDIPGDAQFSLGGTMIRTPREIADPAADWAPGGENYVFLSLGHGTDGGFSYEVKTTETSNSDLTLTPTATNTATLQIARIGDSIIALRQEPGQDWVVHERYSRPDMPETLQVGLVSYTDWGKAGDFTPFFHNSNTLTPGVTPDPTPGQAFNPDLVTGYEYARFARPELPGELAGIDLVNAATDQQLIDFLGDVANQPTPEPGDLASVTAQLTDTEGQPIDTLSVGDDFFLDLYVDDLRPDGTGVFSAYVDAVFDPGLASVNGEIVFGASFPNAQSADTTLAGVIDEVGGIGNTDPGDGDPQLLARIPMVANNAGDFSVATNAADQLPLHEFGLHGMDDPASETAIVFGTDSVSILLANADPVANDDSADLFHNDGVIDVDVLANDTTEPGETLSIASIATPIADGGIFEIVDGQIRFTGDARHYGSVMTDYTISDGQGGESTATLTIQIARQWHLESTPSDTNNDGALSPLDALRVINAIARHGVFPADAVPEEPFGDIDFFLDVNNDGLVSPVDALIVINALDTIDAPTDDADDEALLLFLEEFHSLA